MKSRLIDRRDCFSRYSTFVRTDPIGAQQCIVNRRGIRGRMAFQSRESHRKHPRRRGPSSISSLRLSMTSRRRKYHAVREVQSCGPDVWSRSQSFPDSQKFSITSLFDNSSSPSSRRSIRIEEGIPTRDVGPLSSFGSPTEPRGQPATFPVCVKHLERSGSWLSLSHVKLIPTFFISASRSSSVAHRTRPREDPRRFCTALVILSLSPFFFFVPFACRAFCVHVPSTGGYRYESRELIKEKRVVREKSRRKNAWCRWSTTAKDHLPTTLGQGWSVTFTYA